MLGYIEVMQQVIQTWLDGLADEGEMELNAEMVHVTQQVAGQSFLGKDFHEKVGEEFWAHYETLGKALDPLLPPNLPLPKFIKRDIAKKEMRAILNPIIAERRKNVGKGVYNDFLQDFVEKKMADGTLLDDDTVLGMIIAIMFAGHETTAGQAAWSVIQLLQHPDYLELLQEEIDSKLPHNTVINFETLASLEHVLWAVEETARMKPSADVLFRVVKEEIEIGGYTIPKKWVVVVSADVAHNLPELFENPEKYEPLRFGPERNEKKQHRYALIGFGGGTHKCAGINFAYNEMIMVTALLFQQFELELLTKKPFVDRGLGASKPSVTHIRYKRKPIKTVIDEEIIKQTLAVGCPHLAKQQ